MLFWIVFAVLGYEPTDFNARHNDFHPTINQEHKGSMPEENPSFHYPVMDHFDDHARHNDFHPTINQEHKGSMPEEYPSFHYPAMDHFDGDDDHNDYHPIDMNQEHKDLPEEHFSYHYPPFPTMDHTDGHDDHHDNYPIDMIPDHKDFMSGNHPSFHQALMDHINDHHNDIYPMETQGLNGDYELHANHDGSLVFERKHNHHAYMHGPEFPHDASMNFNSHHDDAHMHEQEYPHEASIHFDSHHHNEDDYPHKQDWDTFHNEDPSQFAYGHEDDYPHKQDWDTFHAEDPSQFADGHDDSQNEQDDSQNEHDTVNENPHEGDEFHNKDAMITDTSNDELEAPESHGSASTAHSQDHN